MHCQVAPVIDVIPFSIEVVPKAIGIQFAMIISQNLDLRVAVLE